MGSATGSLEPHTAMDDAFFQRKCPIVYFLSQRQPFQCEHPAVHLNHFNTQNWVQPQFCRQGQEFTSNPQLGRRL